MLDEIIEMNKKFKQQKLPSEIGIVIAVTPHFVFEINGQQYSSEDFTVYVPAIDRIKQWSTISVEAHSNAVVEIGDLELEPDDYERLFKEGDLIDVSDRGDTFIVHGRLVKL